MYSFYSQKKKKTKKPKKQSCEVFGIGVTSYPILTNGNTWSDEMTSSGTN